jgi:hypothetical protein
VTSVCVLLRDSKAHQGGDSGWIHVIDQKPAAAAQITHEHADAGDRDDRPWARPTCGSFDARCQPGTVRSA